MPEADYRPRKKRVIQRKFTDTALLGAIAAASSIQRFGPSVRELAAKFKVAVGPIHRRLIQLEQKGRVIRLKRGYGLTTHGERTK